MECKGNKRDSISTNYGACLHHRPPVLQELDRLNSSQRGVLTQPADGNSYMLLQLIMLESMTEGTKGRYAICSFLLSEKDAILLHKVPPQALLLS